MLRHIVAMSGLHIVCARHGQGLGWALWLTSPYSIRRRVLSLLPLFDTKPINVIKVTISGN